MNREKIPWWQTASEVLPFVIAATALSRARPEAAGLAIVAVIVGALVGPRFKLDTFAQIAVGLVGVISGVLITSFLLPKLPGPQGWGSLALGTGIAGALRFTVDDVFGRRKIAQAFAAAMLTAVGGFRDPAFAWAVGTFVLAELWVLYLLEPGRARWKDLGTREWFGVAAGLGITGGIAAAIASTLPPLHDRVTEAVEKMFYFQQSGFDTRMELGSMRNMINSRKKVLRVHGKNPVHLRGVVYSKYKDGRWSSVGESPKELRLAAPRSQATTEVEALTRQEQLFVPLGAGRIGTESLRGRITPGGVLFTADGKDNRVWYRLDELEGRPPVSLPSPQDVDVPEALKSQLVDLSRELAGTASTAEELVRGLEQGLSRGFKYSLEYERPKKVDPVINFLTANKQGHCEYFASAMTLLLRSRGVPARVIGGFLVTEENPLGGYFLVRDSNAHAWVEAWVKGAWRTIDPTPPAWLQEQMPESMDAFTSLTDGLVVWTAEIATWIRNRTIGELSAVAFLLLVALLAYRYFRNAGGKQAARVVEADLPLDFFQALMVRLEPLGWVRGPAETLEAFAGRLEPSGPEVAQLIRAYAALRYGRVGDPKELQARVQSLVPEVLEKVKPRTTELSS